MVECVRDYCVVLAEQWLEQTAIGVKAGGIEDGVFGAEKSTDPAFEFLVQILRATDEPYRRHAETM